MSKGGTDWPELPTGPQHRRHQTTRPDSLLANKAKVVKDCGNVDDNPELLLIVVVLFPTTFQSAGRASMNAV